MDFNFHMPVHVVSGEGAVARNSTLLRTLGQAVPDYHRRLFRQSAAALWPM